MIPSTMFPRLFLIATGIAAWPQIFDKTSTTSTSSSFSSPTGNTTYPLLNSTLPSTTNTTTTTHRTLGTRQLPYQIIKTFPRSLPALPLTDPSNITLPVTLTGPITSTHRPHARSLPVVSSDLFNITLPVAQLEGSLSKHARGLPVIGDDPAALYKIAAPLSSKRGLPVVDSDPDALYKITLPVSKGLSSSSSGKEKRDPEIIGELDFPIEYREVDERGLPVIGDDEVSLSVTLPVALNSRGLPVITDDPSAIYKITLPIVKSGAGSSSKSTTSKRAIELSNVPSLHLSVPIVQKRDPASSVKNPLPTDTTTGDNAFTFTLPVTVTVTKGSTAPANSKRAITLRPPTAEENVPMHHYSMEHERSEYGKPSKREPHGVLKMPVVKREKRGLTSRTGREIEKALDRLARRDGEVISMSVANRSDVSYYAQLDFGTPAQSIYVQLDTGSFELWINPTCDNLSSGDQIFCKAVGSYDPSSSSTSSGPSGTASLKYGIGAANISYYKDTIAVGPNSALSNVQFGVASSTEDQFAGIMGLGYGNGDTISYMNLVDELENQNITSTKAFSLGLGAKDKTDGVIVFGGIDTGKFIGPLTKIPIIPADKSPDGVPRYWVQMQNITITPPSGQKSDAYNGSNIPAFLDSGATLTLLPPDVANAIAADFGATDGVSENGFYAVDCDIAKANGTINFAFDGITVKIPYSEMVRTLATSPPTCWLGLIPSTEFTLLGDTFLRSVYTVFDVSNDAAWFAPYGNCDEDLHAISNGTNLATVTGQCQKTANTATLLSSSELATMTNKSDVPAVERTSTPDATTTTTASVPVAVTTSAAGVSPTTAVAVVVTSTSAAITVVATSSVISADVSAGTSAVQTAGASFVQISGGLLGAVVIGVVAVI